MITFAVWGLSSCEHNSENAAEVFGRAVGSTTPISSTDDAAGQGDDENQVPRFKTEKERVDATLAELDKLRQGVRLVDVRDSALMFRAGIKFDHGQLRRRRALYKKFLKGDVRALAAARAKGSACARSSSKLDDALTAV